MTDDDHPIKIDSALLAAAFPSKHRTSAMLASDKVARNADLKYWWGQFAAQVEGETVLIPTRIHFTSRVPALPKGNDAWLFSRALWTRSTNGFERQQAVVDLLQQPSSWSAPFVISLIGSYVIEILDVIFLALTPTQEQLLGSFIAENGAFWETTKRRVTSYWDAYHRLRRNSECGPVFSCGEYVGFKIVNRLEMAASQHAITANH